MSSLESILKRLKELEVSNTELTARIEELQNENTALRLKVSTLEAENNTLKLKKNSRNSSIPPSHDPTRPKRNASLREKGQNKTGGQMGHDGRTLEFSTHPDEVKPIKPENCQNCGKLFEEDRLQHRGETRQVIDIPPLYTITTEYRSYEVVCDCGCKTVGKFPSHVPPGVSYGPNIEAMIAYLSVRQFISMGRIQEYFSGVFNLPISQGTIQNKLNSFHEKCINRYQAIKEELKKSKWVGSDETWIRVNGKKAWFWVWRNAHAVYIVFSSNRKQQTIFNEFSTGLEQAVLVHDRYPAHFNTPAKSHQLCTPHLIRDLNGLIERKESEWPFLFKKILTDALELNKRMVQDRQACFRTEVDQIKSRAAILLNEDPEKHKQKLRSFIKSMKKYEDYLFLYLDDPDIPPDNNISERAIRNSKVKIKVAGQFKTPRGAETFACIRSVVDSSYNDGQNIFARFLQIANST